MRARIVRKPRQVFFEMRDDEQMRIVGAMDAADFALVRHLAKPLHTQARFGLGNVGVCGWVWEWHLGRLLSSCENSRFLVFWQQMRELPAIGSNRFRRAFAVGFSTRCVDDRECQMNFRVKFYGGSFSVGRHSEFNYLS